MKDWPHPSDPPPEPAWMRIGCAALFALSMVMFALSLADVAAAALRGLGLVG